MPERPSIDAPVRARRSGCRAVLPRPRHVGPDAPGPPPPDRRSDLRAAEDRYLAFERRLAAVICGVVGVAVALLGFEAAGLLFRL